MAKKIKFRNRHKYSLRDHIDNPTSDDDALRRELWRQLLTAFPNRIERQAYMCTLINDLERQI